MRARISTKSLESIEEEKNEDTSNFELYRFRWTIHGHLHVHKIVYHQNGGDEKKFKHQQQQYHYKPVYDSSLHIPYSRSVECFVIWMFINFSRHFMMNRCLIITHSMCHIILYVRDILCGYVFKLTTPKKNLNWIKR